ncbi:MAG: hypothetical protein JWO03_388 [Bacteroidetes bacterium]|nr:hypothetical protein [Bacteroidota bacterium]
MPPLYLVQNNKQLGKVPLLQSDLEQLDTAQQLCVTCYDTDTEIDGADAKGHIVQMFSFKLHDNGTFKGSGGGYLLYDTWQKKPFNLLIRVNGQF